MKKLYFILFASLFFLIPYDTFAYGLDSSRVIVYGGGDGLVGTHTFTNQTYFSIAPNEGNNHYYIQSTDIYFNSTSFGAGQRLFISYYVGIIGQAEITRISSPGIRGDTGGGAFTIANTSVLPIDVVTYYGGSGPTNGGIGYLYILELEVRSAVTTDHISMRIDSDYGYLTTQSIFYFGRPIINHEWNDTDYGFNQAILNALNNMNNSGVISAINNQTSAITDAQQDTTDAINDMNDSINDSSTTEANNTASGFFNGFRTEPTGHLTSIVTAPLTLFSAMTSNTCTPITLPFNFDILHNIMGIDIPDKNIVLPCGTTLFWENSSLAPKVTNFRAFWNLLLGAPLIYGCLVLLMQSFNNAIDPLNDELVFLGTRDIQEENRYERFKKRSGKK